MVVHLRGLVQEMKELTAAGIDYKGRLFLSDRAHIVFDFHQKMDGLNEARLGGNKLGNYISAIKCITCLIGSLFVR